MLSKRSVPVQDLLFDVFKLLDVWHFDVVGVMRQKVDGVGHHVLRQQRQQLVCWHTHTVNRAGEV